MSVRPLKVKAPGKLMIAGEFAVLQPHQKLAVMAVDRFVYTTLHPGTPSTLNLEDFNLTGLTWSFTNTTVTIDTDDKRINFVKEAIQYTLTYLQEQGFVMKPFSLTVKSELDDTSGKKYGLGSSAAVVTSVVAAILHHFLSEQPTKKLIFKLASMAHVKVQGNGSGADIAASTYGSVLEYASFQAEWLLKEMRETASVTELIEKNWTYLHLKPVHLPEQLNLYIGWTGKPASTSQLVDKVLKLKANQPEQFETFLNTSTEAVNHFFEGIRKDDMTLLMKGVRENRHALATVGEQAGADLETPLLKVLCDLTEEHGGAGKQSGAGGGDCGLAFMPSETHATPLLSAWEAAGIQPLELDISPSGATVLD